MSKAAAREEEKQRKIEHINKVVRGFLKLLHDDPFCLDLPTEIRRLKKMHPGYARAIDNAVVEAHKR